MAFTAEKGGRGVCVLLVIVKRLVRRTRAIWLLQKPASGSGGSNSGSDSGGDNGEDSSGYDGDNGN